MGKLIMKGVYNMNSKQNMTQQEYAEFVKQETPNSTLGINCLKAFLIGGLICTIGEGLMQFYKSLDLSQNDASTMVSVTLVFLGALLTGLDIYPKIAKHAGAGTIVPITGFANSIASVALDSRSEGYVLGVGSKIFTVAGPVILYSTVFGIVYGIIYYCISFFL